MKARIDFEHGKGRISALIFIFILVTLRYKSERSWQFLEVGSKKTRKVSVNDFGYD